MYDLSTKHKLTYSQIGELFSVDHSRVSRLINKVKLDSENKQAPADERATACLSSLSSNPQLKTIIKTRKEKEQT